MNSGFESLSDFFQTNPALTQLRGTIKEDEIRNRFYEVFPDLRGLVFVSKISKSVIFLSVENSSLRSELKFNEQKIIEKINTFFSEKRISKIKFI